jgi:hypothetical protein
VRTFQKYFIKPEQLRNNQVTYYTVDKSKDNADLFKDTDKVYFPEDAKLLKTKYRTLHEAIHNAQALGLNHDRKQLGLNAAPEQASHQR